MWMKSGYKICSLSSCVSSSPFRFFCGFLVFSGAAIAPSVLTVGGDGCELVEGVEALQVGG
jgi:hypothetical protein